MCLERAGLLPVAEATELCREINAEKGSSLHAVEVSPGTLPILSRMSSLSASVTSTVAALLENNEASATLTTANGGTFTSSSARLSSQSRYSIPEQ